MIKRSLILFFVFMYAFFVFSANAQVQNTDIVLDINPTFPKVNENVTATLSTHSTDLKRSKISWILNGKKVADDVGNIKFLFKTGDIGSQTKIEADIETSDGSFISKTINITPSDIDLLWEASDSYVPPFYKGKALATSQGKIKVVALTGTKGSFSYDWQQDDNNEPSYSGYGKNFYSYTNSYLDSSNTVGVNVSTISGSTIGTGQTTISIANPKIVFYRKDPIFGTQWENALSDGSTIDPNGEIIVAEPYFFSPQDLNSQSLSFKWTLGGQDVSTPNPKNEIGIVPGEGQTGSSTINLNIENINTLFLSLQKKLNVNF